MAVLEVGPAESLSVPGDPQRTPAGCKALWPKYVSAALGSEPGALRGTSQTVNTSTCPETPQDRGRARVPTAPLTLEASRDPCGTFSGTGLSAFRV